MSLAVACAAALAAPVSIASVQGVLDNAIRAADLRDTRVAYLVMDLDTGEVLGERSPDDLVIPASNLKLFTSAAALGTLGPEFSFQTRLRWVQLEATPGTPGMEKAQSLLVVQGGGDPAFGDPKVLQLTPPEALKGTAYEGQKLDVDLMLRIWVDLVVAKGIKQIDRLLLDDRVFDDRLVHESWPRDQLHLWYCAPVSGLNFHANTVDLHVEPAGEGQPPVVRGMPRSSYYTLQNRAITGTTQTVWATRRPESAVLMLAGRVQQGTIEPLVLSLPDPPMYLGVTLADRLKLAGVAVGSVGRMGQAESLPAGELLHTVQTPLIQVITRCNKDSQNLYAEALLKRLGRQLSGAAGSWPTGVAALRDFLQKRFGVQAARVQAQDGSGLSAGNRVTARVTVELLRAMHRDRALARIYRDSLAEGGKDGSLGPKNFDAASINSRLFAKTGFINGVRSLSGYLVHTRPDGQERVIGFSLYFNDDKPGVYGHVIRDLRNRMVQLIDQRTR